MNLPAFNADGDLPPGVYPVTLTAALARFGHGSPQRQVAARRLARVYQLATSTGHVARFVVFGSFVTAKADPRDVDVVLIMDDAFDVGEVAGEAEVVFRHADADAQLGASVFWAAQSGAFGGEQAMVDYWQTRRDGGLRGILDLVPEAP
ncbi:MAG: hypothetical protein K2P78_12160 [Gemmataceae bacterium]|nr:hypothetical protein [Gemmataceae bacterium]